MEGGKSTVSLMDGKSTVSLMDELLGDTDTDNSNSNSNSTMSLPGPFIEVRDVLGNQPWVWVGYTFASPDKIAFKCPGNAKPYVSK